MALFPQNPRDKSLMLVIIVVLGAAVGYQQYLWAPKHEELSALATRLDTLDSLNRIAKTEVAKGTATKFKAEADAFSRELTVLRGLVPTENEVPALVESASTAARRAGLELSDVQPDGVVNGDQFDTYRFKLSVTGPYHKVAEFLTNVGSMRRIVAPINVMLLPSARAGETKAKKNEQLLDAHFQFQTYVAHTAASQAAQAAQSGQVGTP